jgi:hypothetical protein
MGETTELERFPLISLLQGFGLGAGLIIAIGCAGYLGHPFRKLAWCARLNRLSCRTGEMRVQSTMPILLALSGDASNFTKGRFNSCCLCSPQSSSESVSVFTCSKNVFCFGSNHQRPLYWLLSISVPKKSTHAGSNSAFSLQSMNQISGFKISFMPIYLYILILERMCQVASTGVKQHLLLL